MPAERDQRKPCYESFRVLGALLGRLQCWSIKASSKVGLVHAQMGKLQLGTTSLTQHYSILLLRYRNTNSSADNCTAEFKLK